MVHEKYKQLYYDIVTYLNRCGIIEHSSKAYDEVVEPYGFGYDKANKCLIIYDLNKKESGEKLIYSDELLDVHIIAHKSYGYGILKDRTEYIWTNKKTNQRVNSRVFWKVMRLIEGTYKEFQPRNASEVFRNLSGCRIFNLSPKDFKKKFQFLIERYGGDYVRGLNKDYYVYDKSDIKSFTIILTKGFLNQVVFCVMPSKLGVGVGSDALTSELMSNILRYAYYDTFEMFQNDYANKEPIPSYYKSIHNHMLEVSAFVAYSMGLYEAKYKYKFSDTKLRKEIINITTKK